MPFSFAALICNPLLEFHKIFNHFLCICVMCVYILSLSITLLSTCCFYALLHPFSSLWTPSSLDISHHRCLLCKSHKHSLVHVQTFKYWFLSTFAMRSNSHFLIHFQIPLLLVCVCLCALFCLFLTFFLYACCVCFIDHMLWKSRNLFLCLCGYSFSFFFFFSWLVSTPDSFSIEFSNISIGWKHFLSLLHLTRGLAKQQQQIKFQEKEAEKTGNDRQRVEGEKGETREV